MVVSILVINLYIIALLMVFIDNKKIPRTPQENGVVQRINRTIMEHARSMRLHVGLPLHIWVEAVNTTIYLINRGPSTPLGCGILEEAWCNAPPRNPKELT